jgi:hypothetical protein
MKYINLFLFGGMIVMNYLANALPLNNITTGELSDAYPNLFVPAGITFSIWGVIYILLAVFCLMQFLSSYQSTVKKIILPFALTCLFNALWIVCWHYKMLLLSMSVMVILLITLIFINKKVREIPLGFIKAAFGIYLGWICIATIANFTVLLVYYNWKAFGISEQIWTIIMILTGTIITSASVRKLHNPFIGLAVLWAFAGIVLKRYDDYFSIVLTALIAMTIVVVVTINFFFRRTAF